MRQASRMQTIGTESAFEVTARARALQAEGRDIIFLQIGEPDFDTPENVREAAKRALDAGETHYAPFAGIPALREAIADDATARKGFPVTPDRVFVTVGGKGVMLYAILGLIDPATRRSCRIPATRSTSRSSASSAARPSRSRSAWSTTSGSTSTSLRR